MFRGVLFFSLVLTFLPSCTKTKNPNAKSVGQSAQMKDYDPKVTGNPEAPKGGTFYISLSAEPTTLHPIKATDYYSQNVHAYVLEGLMVTNVETYELEPALAERYEADPKGMWYKFYLRKDAKFHDGTPVTAKDVKFSFDAIMNDDFQAFHLRPYYENVKDVETLDDHTVKFNIKQKYFNNLRVVATLSIAPEHVYKNPKAEGLNKMVVGTGPYKIEKDDYKTGKAIILSRNKDWWGFNTPHMKGYYHPDKVYFRFVKEDTARLALLRKLQLDFAELRPEDFVKKTDGAPFGTKVLKKQVENSAPKSYGYIGWNLNNKLFQDRRVRVALAHLMNRELMNQKFRYDMSLPATGPWYLQSPYADQEVKPFLFDPEKAKALFTEAGWTDSDKDGILDKVIGGQKTPFKFTLLYANRDNEKYYTLYREDLKKSGIDMELKVVEWNSFIATIDEKKFDAVSLGWGGGSVDNDPKQIWHSSSAATGGSNFISYANTEVDKLIEQGRQELDKDKRIRVFQKVYRMIAEDAPYALMFVDKFNLYAHTAKMQQEASTYAYGIGTDTWWITE